MVDRRRQRGRPRRLLRQVRLLAHDAGDLRRGRRASNSILTTWWISFERIRSERRSAADLLSLMSFFDRQATGRDKCEESDLKGRDDESDDTFEDDIAFGAGDMFEMHGLVQLSTRGWLQACGIEQSFQHKYIELMAKAFPKPYYNNWPICRRLFAYVRAAAEYRPAGGDEEKIWATLLYNGGWYASAEGSYAIAERMLRKSLTCFERSLGQEAEATLECRAIYANVLGIQGRTLETLRSTLGLRHRATISSRNYLTSLYWK
ncbi:hypothetical protein C8A01DRAFT_51165 [Parachaetomium inaequale]|uniref:Uncharacterized protein n=1 Tax=Parachaetomium inaequale TaxID=2588326 RepID=A0AAN6P528_9PEZI|nr:hypothetical protein C8A01DRAFT_51165 [Parachaetomium inaequale]